MRLLDKYDEDFLEHYGTKGMKWGVRKGGKSSGPKVTAKGVRVAGKVATGMVTYRLMQKGMKRPVAVLGGGAIYLSGEAYANKLAKQGR